MRAALEQLARAARLVIRRGSVALANYLPVRTVLQINGRAGEVRQSVELLLPYGMSAVPDAGDVIFFQIGGAPDHLIALGADNPKCRIAGLVTGEFGLGDNQGAQQQRIVFKRGEIVITAPFALRVEGDLHVTGAVIAGYGGADQVGLQTHTHNQPPDSHGDSEQPTNPPNAGS